MTTKTKQNNPNDSKRPRPLINILIPLLFPQTLLVDPSIDGVRTSKPDRWHWLRPAVWGSIQKATFPVEIFRACLSATRAKDEFKTFLLRNGVAENFHPELLVHLFP